MRNYTSTLCVRTCVKLDLKVDKGGGEEGRGETLGSREVLQDDAGRLKWHFYVLMLHDIPI